MSFRTENIEVVRALITRRTRSGLTEFLLLQCAPSENPKKIVKKWWELAGGNIEPTDNSLRAAITRETLQETGCDVRLLSQFTLLQHRTLCPPARPGLTYSSFGVLAELNEGQNIKVSSEHLDATWQPMNRAIYFPLTLDSALAFKTYEDGQYCHRVF